MPPDARMNAIIHAALRRDLDRVALLTAPPAELDPARLRAVGEHTVWLMEELHGHHSNEDDRLFPLMRRSDAGNGALLDELESEHAAIAAAVTDLEAAGRRAAAGEPDAATGLAGATAGLRAVLDPHLAHEERVVPGLMATLDEADFADFEKGNTAGKSPKQLAMTGHWLLDNLDESSAAVVKGQVPPIPRFLLVHLLGGPYKTRATACWGGTPAAAVRAVPGTAA